MPGKVLVAKCLLIHCSPACRIAAWWTSVTLESVRSASHFFINDKEQEVRRIISANHLKSIREGGLWNCTHNSKGLHLWEVGSDGAGA
jgi:hypothetical protein